MGNNMALRISFHLWDEGIETEFVVPESQLVLVIPESKMICHVIP